MKNSLLLVLFAISLWSCDPNTVTTTSITNETLEDARLVFYSADSIEDIDLPAGKRYVIFRDELSTLTGGPIQLDLESEDSIFIFFPQEQIIKFYPDSSNLSSGKNIYINDDWNTSSDDNDYVVTFRVTEEDLADAQN